LTRTFPQQFPSCPGAARIIAGIPTHEDQPFAEGLQPKAQNPVQAKARIRWRQEGCEKTECV